MKNIFFSFFLFIILCFSIGEVFAQPRYIMTFDAVTPGSLPGGWSIINNAGFSIRPSSQWQVRDSGQYISYLSPFTSTRSRSGKRAISVNYYASYDSTQSRFKTADTYLVSPQLTTITGDSLRFFATGGYNTSIDSLQIWVSPAAPFGFIKKLGTIVWIPGSPYGQFKRYTYSLTGFTGGVYIGFRYYMDCSGGDGYMVQIDDFALGLSVGVENISGEVPQKFALSQNYPNPFNPNTTIKFDIAKQSSYRFAMYNILGMKVYETGEENLSPGTYNLDLNMSAFASGTYFYTLQAGDFFEKKRMMLVK